MAVIMEAQKEDMEWHLTHARQVQREINIAKHTFLEEKLGTSSFDLALFQSHVLPLFSLKFNFRKPV